MHSNKGVYSYKFITQKNEVKVLKFNWGFIEERKHVHISILDYYGGSNW